MRGRVVFCFVFVCFRPEPYLLEARLYLVLTHRDAVRQQHPGPRCLLREYPGVPGVERGWGGGEKEGNGYVQQLNFVVGSHKTA